MSSRATIDSSKEKFYRKLSFRLLSAYVVVLCNDERGFACRYSEVSTSCDPIVSVTTSGFFPVPALNGTFICSSMEVKRRKMSIILVVLLPGACLTVPVVVHLLLLHNFEIRLKQIHSRLINSVWWRAESRGQAT